MTLVQYYNKKAKELGYNNFNQMVEDYQIPALKYLKKKWKKQHKELALDQISISEPLCSDSISSET